MARCVNNINGMVVPFTMGGRRSNGNASFLFQFHGIHDRTCAVFAPDFIDFMDSVGIKKNPFSKRGFTGINMGTDSNISYPFKISDHFALSLKIKNPLKTILSATIAKGAADIFNTIVLL
jgi:hypothetical protein